MTFYKVQSVKFWVFTEMTLYKVQEVRYKLQDWVLNKVQIVKLSGRFLLTAH